MHAVNEVSWVVYGFVLVISVLLWITNEGEDEAQSRATTILMAVAGLLGLFAGLHFTSLAWLVSLALVAAVAYIRHKMYVDYSAD